MKTLYFNCKVVILLHMLTVITTMIKQDYFFNCTTVTNFFMQNVASHFYILNDFGLNRPARQLHFSSLKACFCNRPAC